MEYTSDAAYRLRELTYPVQNVPERFLLDAVDTIFHVINHPSCKWRAADYLAAVREALTSTDDLAKLTMLDDDCTDAVVREFLRRAEAALAKRVEIDRT